MTFDLDIWSAGSIDTL